MPPQLRKFLQKNILLEQFEDIINLEMNVPDEAIVEVAYFNQIIRSYGDAGPAKVSNINAII